MKSVGAAAAKKAEAKAETTDAAEETEEAPTGDNNGFFTDVYKRQVFGCTVTEKLR